MSPKGHEKETKKVQTTARMTINRYWCEVDGCDAHVEDDRDPRGDPDVGDYRCNVGHDINYVSLNPYNTVADSLREEVGVYVCRQHIGKAMELIEEKLNEAENQ